MKTQRIFGLLTVLAVLVAILPVSGTVKADTGQTTVTYPDITLPAGFTSLPMPDAWDLNQGPVVITYSLDLSGAPNVAYDWNWNLMGIVGLFDATNASGARMVGFLSDWQSPQNLSPFPTYPDHDATLDNDDKFNLQRFPNPGSYDETMYDVKCDTNDVVPHFGSGNNYGIWFDRDGVDQYQDDMWGMVNGGTYNTGGVYPVELTFRKNSASLGTACPLVFPALTNTSVPGGKGIPTGFYSLGWNASGPDKIPAGLSFTSDASKMRVMHVVVEGASGAGAIIIHDLTVTGYPSDLDGPITSNVVASPNPAAIGSSVTVTANVDDSTTGGANIASAEYSLDGGAWIGMSASDGAFDEISEDVATATAFTAPSTPGRYDLCVRGTDEYANVGTPACTTLVVNYIFVGFFQPIDMGATNIAKAGQIVPVKWQLLDALGMPVSDPASFVALRSQSGVCNPDEPADAVETYSGVSGLQYLGDGYWQFNWKTPKSYAGQCRVMYVEFQGGLTSEHVDFQFK